jgi:Skp family chaperone for outer membrane proteins
MERTISDGDQSTPSDALPAQDATAGRRLPWFAVAVALALIVAYLAGLVAQWIEADVDNESVWARRDSLFVGLEALAFAAVGAVLGVQVQRTATSAQVRAEREQTAAELERVRAEGARKVEPVVERATELAREGKAPEAAQELNQLRSALEEASKEFDERVQARTRRRV